MSVSCATDIMSIFAAVEIGLRKLFPQFAGYSILLGVIKGVNKCKIFKLAFFREFWVLCGSNVAVLLLYIAPMQTVDT